MKWSIPIVWIYSFVLATGCQSADLVNFDQQQDSDAVDDVTQSEVDSGLVFHHPGGVASNGEHVLLADRNNNRVLVWTTFPENESDAPDLVLGQENFESTDSGNAVNQMNWPTAVATDGERWMVTDTYNNRVLVWNTLPTENGQAPDLILTEGIVWPWAVWSDGTKLLIASTGSGEILIWNEFPTKDSSSDFSLKIPEFGTPRSIGSDGEHLIISDHNAKVEGRDGPGTFFWDHFPTSSDDPYDFFTESPGNDMAGEVLWSPILTEEDVLIAVGQRSLYIWNEFPTKETVESPDSIIGNFRAGDSSGVAWDGEHLLASLDNDNVLWIFEGIPEDEPDLILGVPQYWITNPVPLINEGKLVVTSDFDRTLSIWDEIPENPAETPPNSVYSLPDAPWDSTAFNGEIYLAGASSVMHVTTDGVEVLYNKFIGSTRLNRLNGITMDEQYFYLADGDAGKIYIWQLSSPGVLPDADEDPSLILDLPQVRRISSDGETLAAITLQPGGSVNLFRVDELKDMPEPSTLSRLNYDLINLPEDVLVKEGQLFVASTISNAVLIWDDIEDAFSKGQPSRIYGAQEPNSSPGHGNGLLFWPGAIDYSDGLLWLGEFKFSDRLMSVEL